MPRQPRLDAPGTLHHVMGRGIEKRSIFRTDRDLSDFVGRLALRGEGGAMEIYAWALLPNHFHLLCKTKSQPLADSMRKLLTGYAVNFNRRHDRNGHLFQNRYKSIVCQEESYFMELVRYIHLNPIRAGLVQDMKGLNRWLWSGHSALVGRVKRSWQNIDCVLALFGDGRLAKENYLKFVLKGINQGRRPELVGGGLIRSIGGWSEVLALRKRRDKEASDPRVLGDAQFVSRLLSKEEPLTESASSRRKGMELPQIAERICRVHGITLCELRSGSRRPEIVEARRVVSWIGIKTLGYAGADIARYLGVTNSCVTRAASRGKPEHLESYIG